MVKAWAGAFAVAAGLLATASCAAAPETPAAAGEGPAAGSTARPAAADGTCSGFALSLASDHGGRPTPVAAAEWFAHHGGVADVPDTGWREVGRDEAGSLVRSDGVTLHVVQGADQTWFVDSGQRC